MTPRRFSSVPQRLSVRAPRRGLIRSMLAVALLLAAGVYAWSVTP